MIKINYFEYTHYFTDIILGHILLEGITETITPLFKDDIDNENKYPIFITCFFKNRKEYRWEVKRTEVNYIDDNNLAINIWLHPKNISDDIYLSQTLKKKNKRSAKSLLYIGKIIIVEFGHVYSCVTLESGVETNKRYPDSIQHGEMHKRRPAIVVKADDRGVKVIPLTSKKPKDLDVNMSVFQLSKESQKNIGDFSKEETYALCNMIQTVCITRILPPLFKLNSRKKHFRNEDYRATLCRNDIKLLDRGLLSSISKNKLYIDIEQLKNKNNHMEIEINELKKELLILKEMYMYTNESTSLNISDVDNEILQFKKTNLK